MNKKQLQSEQTKKRIVDAARALFVQKGYKATSIEDIVAATGSSKGNIYYHFKSKEGLFLTLLEDWDREWDVQWSQKEAQYTSVAEKLYGMTDHLVRDDMNHPLTKASDEFFNSDEISPEGEERIAQLVENHLQFFRKLISQGIENQEFKSENVEHVAITLESLFLGLSQMARKLTLDEALALYQSAIGIFLHGMVKKSA
ncbi:TetR/AcrR family transcriptional regulator [Brevibacillus invocatus]|uniref:TetR/AcrR family transcriptional regulator n=1 Tax=Brevibacillus invocatus TaxID=173959 RepID=UPI00203B56E3|nr:TetR/AcrR family transcriptional regulator [Brevibacillus invocatus]MCM3080685.1 TetR/AcrR family transcriptional regulator [Brevibacillus invocatus]MCM3431266.1 TetR/AcrR family transcriptional regulator [Brevibacillus invocatus]